MFAHSSLLTTATQFAAKARGTAMSLVAFAFMVGGAVGTALGGRLIEATNYREFYFMGGVALVALSAVAAFAVPKADAPPAARTQANRATPSDRASGDPAGISLRETEAID